MEVPKLVLLRLIITVDGDVEKASYATVELMDSVGSSSATDRKMTDNDGRVSFQALTGLHRVRITGPNIQPYEGELEIFRNEASHVERIRVRPAQDAHQPGGTALPAGLVSASRLRIPDRAHKAFEKAAEAMRRQHWQESRTLFESAIREYPEYDLAYNGLGMVQMQLNELESARNSFSKAIELNADFSAAYRNLARISFAERNYEEADALLTKSLAGDPLNVWALSSAANAELLTHKYSEAIAHAQKAHSCPHEGLAGVHIVAALALEARQQPSEAIQEYQLYLDEEPNGRDADRAQKAITRLSSQAVK
ncbi:MAG TPA: tetratricopeptide repeat protein [Candidatus Sulfotelmatobacter sp.]|nr:tetratricopeptide repeat protein [Candidatus Sulfotelmatobacter sp.]